MIHNNEEGAEGLGQLKWLITSSSSSLICGGSLVMTTNSTGAMSMLFRPEQWGCSRVDRDCFIRWIELVMLIV